MLLGGVAVEDRLVRDLAAIVDRSLGAKLEMALLLRAKVMGLTREERAAILAALEKAPAELRGVRDVLLSDDNWRPHKRL